MPNPKHVRFDNKPTKRAHSDDEDDDDDDDAAPEQEPRVKKQKIIKEEDKDEQKCEHSSAPAGEAAVASNVEVDSKWENLVYYYLARLKGLCDWSSESPETGTATSTGSLKSCNSENIEERVLKNVATENYSKSNKYWAGNKRLNRPGQSEVSSYMAAGYQEGKEQGVKIITRALKYGVLSGILAKVGSSYKIHPKYMKTPPSAESSSDSDISVLTSGSSSKSGGSIGRNKAKHRTGLGAKSDKYQTEPDTVNNVQMKRSFSHNEINIFHKKPTKHHQHDRPRSSSDMSFSRSSTSNNVQLAKHNDQIKGVSSNKKHRGEETKSRNSRRAPSRDGLKSRQRLSRAQTRVQESRSRSRSRQRLSRAQTREQASQSRSRDQRRKTRRPKSSSSKKSNY